MIYISLLGLLANIKCRVTIYMQKLMVTWMKESSDRVEDFMLETTRGCLSAAGWEAVPGLGQELRAQLFARKSRELKEIHCTMGIL